MPVTVEERGWPGPTVGNMSFSRAEHREFEDDIPF
jgi:hypothetical protein